MTIRSNNQIHILFASRLVQEKGVDILIASIRSTLSDARFQDVLVWHVCSDGPYQADIIDLSHQYPGKVLYHGSVTQVGLATLYRQADFLFMPSRFLETFGLTALESLACGTPVIGFQRGGLTSFISDILALDRSEPISSLLSLLEREMNTPSEPIDVASYSQRSWTDKLSSLFGSTDQSILLLHDYREKIGGAEYYVSRVEEIFEVLRYDVSHFGYEGKTTPWKRRWMFIFSLFAFHRGMRLTGLLKEKQPKIIWMHSVQRYLGYWSIRAVRNYVRLSGAKTYMSHHDVGLIAPFPQDITEESEIPKDPGLSAFTQNLKIHKKIIATIKWLYIQFLRSNLPENMEHIIFAPFLEKHIYSHFPNQKIHIFPHSYDEKIFHL